MHFLIGAPGSISLAMSLKYLHVEELSRPASRGTVTEQQNTQRRGGKMQKEVMTGK